MTHYQRLVLLALGQILAMLRDILRYHLNGNKTDILIMGSHAELAKDIIKELTALGEKGL